MRIDVHTHIGRVGGHTSTPAELDAWADRQQIDCVWVSNAAAAATPGQTDDRDEVDANAACLEACRSHARFRPLYWVRPGRRDSNVNALCGALVSEPFVGAVFAPLWNDFFGDAALLDPYLAVLTKLELPAFFQTARDERASPERIYSLVRRHPEARFVLYDALSDAHRDDAIRVAQRCVHRGVARVLLDTAGADATAVAAAVNKAGPDCLVFGSGACLWSPAPGRDRAALAPEALRGVVPDDAFERITRQNALALFNPVPTHAAVA